RYENLLHDYLMEQIKDAAIEWLKATAENIIPQWSGASAATFIHLARAVGHSLSITPSSTAPNRMSLGERSGNAELKADKSTGSYSFIYSTTLEHLVYNEHNNANLN